LADGLIGTTTIAMLTDNSFSGSPTYQVPIEYYIPSIENNATLAHVDRGFILCPDYVPYKPIEEIMFTIAVSEPEPMPTKPPVLDPDTEQRLIAYYFSYLLDKHHLPPIYALGDICIDVLRYYGTYSGCDVVFITDCWLGSWEKDWKEPIAGHLFAYQSNRPILVCKDGVFMPIDEAYNAEWITQEDVGSIWDIHHSSALKHKVTFMDSGVVLSEQFVVRWEAATAPDDPAKEGFVFAGWSSAFDRISSDRIIDAVWRPSSVVSLEVGQTFNVEYLTLSPTSDWIHSISPSTGIDVTQSWVDEQCCKVIIGSSPKSMFTFAATTPGTYTVTLAHVDRGFILCPDYVPYKPIEEIIFTIAVSGPEPMHIVPLSETMACRIKSDFLGFIGWSTSHVDLQYINKYNNGIAMFVKDIYAFSL
jgi:hypothetical protein